MSSGPWAVAPQLLAAGWEIVPLPAGQKSPPPAGLTGAEGEAMSEDLLLEFTMSSNVGIRVPRNVVGLDFDAYKNSAILKVLEHRLGALPPTFAVSNHDSPMTEGLTMFFLVPEDTEFEAGWKEVDVIQHRHRYQVVSPSVHPSGRVYRWLHTSVPDAETGIPEVGMLAELPKRWLEFFKRKAKKVAAAGDGPFILSEEDSAEMCPMMRKVLQKHLRGILAATARHDAGVAASWSLASLRAAGHQGYSKARAIYLRSFLESFKREGSRAGNEAEAFALFASAEAKMQPPRKGCACGSGRKTRRKAGTSSAIFK